MNRLLAKAALLAIVAAVGTPAPAASAAPREVRDAQVWSLASQNRSEQIRLLEQVVNIDSGTGDEEGGAKVAAILGEALRNLGAEVSIVPAEMPGLAPNLIATLTGSGRGSILLIGHLDTVFERGTTTRRPFRMDVRKANGPGVSDEKGGVIEAIFALKILQKMGFHDFRKITLLVESSEERGSPGTRRLIRELVDHADVELNLEPGDPPDAVTVWRKGSAAYQIDVVGRAAHAGVAPELGRNAAVELIHQIQASHWPTSGTGLTANLTLMSAGTRGNIIPDHASALINVRYREKADLARVDSEFRENARVPSVPDTKVTITTDGAYPPLSETPEVGALADRAARIYSGLGLTLGRGGNGGASESALAQEAGVPAIDGLGPVGGGFHSDDEFLDLGTLTPRLYLLTKLMMELGRDPPGMN